MFTDLRFALSSIRRRPFVAAAVILTLGLGIGANVAIFRAFNAAFLRPLPFRDGDRLMRVVLAADGGDARISPRTDVFLALRDHQRSFSSVAGQRYNDLTLLDRGEPQRVAGIQVSEGWTRTMGVTPQLGRTFSADEERQGTSSGVVLISNAMWRTRFGRTRSILGRVLSLDGRPFTAIGVLPPGVRFPYEADVWLPVRFEQQLESTWALNIVGRLRDGVSPAAAVAELRDLSTRLDVVKAQPGMRLLPMPLRETLIDDEGPIVIAVTIAAAFLLLLVAVNVANLLGVHSMSRQREFAIRTALGASFSRHLRQTMTEGLVLAIAGGVTGAVIAAGLTSLLSVLVPENFSYVFEQVPVDGRVLFYFIGVVLLTGLVFGTVPALRTRKEPQEYLIGATRTTEDRSSKWRATSGTIAQIALALVLLVAAHSVIRDVQRQLARDLGYDTRNILTAQFVLPAERYPGAEERGRFYETLTRAIESAPGVDAAGTVNLFPAAGHGTLLARMEGEGVPYRPESPLLAHNRFVHGRLMEAMRLRVIAGRLMTADELHRGDAVAVISREVAQSLWPNEEPIGKRLRNRRRDDARWVRVVGVVADLEEFYADTRRSIWTPLRFNTEDSSSAQATLVIRSTVAPESLAATIRATIQRLDPAMAVFDIATAEETYRNSLTGRESARTLTGLFGALGLVVAAIGVYASMAFAMTRRTREIAVRMALGATPRILTRQFLGHSAMVIGTGLLLGIAATSILGRADRSLTAEFPISPLSVFLAGIVLATVAITASWMPLRRAMRLDPSTVLQQE